MEASPDDGLAVIEDTEFARRAFRVLAVLLAVVALGTALVFALPLLGAL